MNQTKTDIPGAFLIGMMLIFTSPIWLLILVGLAFPLLCAFAPVFFTVVWLWGLLKRGLS